MYLYREGGRRMMRALIKKELRIFLRKRFQFFSLLTVITIFVIAFNLENSNKFNPILISSFIVTFFVPYTFGWISFQKEKENKNISYLLASPLNIKEIFLGKMLAVLLFTQVFMLWGVIVQYVTNIFSMGLIPNFEILLTVLITFPIWSAVLSGLVGVGLLVFDNPFIIRILLFLFIFFVGMNGNLWEKLIILEKWQNLILIFLGLMAILGIIYFVDIFGKRLMIE
jgi:ABC-2 type transport system permease protein